MAVFATPGHLASWGGTAPGANESAGPVKSTKTRPGIRYLKRALGTAAMAVSRSQATYLGAKYRRITARRGPMKALVAVEHSILTTGEVHRDPRPDYFINANRPGPGHGPCSNSRNSATPSPWNPSFKPGKTAGRPYFHVSRAGRS
jgi:hypothetical protein